MQNAQTEKGFSLSAVALSVLTAALAEGTQAGVSVRGMVVYGAAQAALLTLLSAVLYACWQKAGHAAQQAWLFAAGIWLLAQLCGTALQAQTVCRQEFRSMALVGLLPLLLWAGWKIAPDGWNAPARVLWWFAVLGILMGLVGTAGQMRWAHLLTSDAMQLARCPHAALYAEYLVWPVLCPAADPRRAVLLPWLAFLAQAGLAGGMCLVFGATAYPEQELLRAWSVGVFSRMDAMLLLLWLTCAVFRIGALCAAVRMLWRQAFQGGKGAAQ